jgi:hypothetical protein
VAGYKERAVAVDGSGNVIVTGESRGNGTGPDYYTAKYAATDGAVLWEKRYDGPASRYATSTPSFCKNCSGQPRHVTPRRRHPNEPASSRKEPQQNC